MKYLPEDVIMLILVKFPVKPLMRLRCVCKSWYHLIRNPSFIKMHQLSMENNKNECIIIKCERKRGIPILCFHSYESLNVISPPMEIPQLNSNGGTPGYVSWPCNGLLLFASSTSTTWSFVLCNPSTREFKLLPPRPFRYVNVGLCFDSNKDNYKVIALHKEYRINTKVEVYNLSTNTWRQIKHNNKLPCIYNEAECTVQGVPINGALHWTAYSERNGHIILSFNVSTELFKELKLPKEITHPQCIGKSLTIISNCLSLFAYKEESELFEPKFVDIWVMKEYGAVDSWTKQVRFGANSSFDLIIPRLFWKNETLLVEKDRQRLELWDMDTQEKTDTGIIRYRGGSHSFMVYKESLVSVN